MSTTQIELEAREQRVKELVPWVEGRLDDVDKAAKVAVKVGAELGTHLEELSKRHKDSFGTWLMGVTTNTRVTDFAFRAARHMRKHPELEDSAQLTFALLDSPEASGERPCRTDGTDVTSMLGWGQKLRLLVSKWGEEPETWSEGRRKAFVQVATPLVDLRVDS